MDNFDNAHWGDPCKFCGRPHDEVEIGDCPGAVWMQRAEAAETELIELKRAIAELANGLDEEADQFKVLKQNALNNPDSVIFTQLDQKHRVTRDIASQVRALLG